MARRSDKGNNKLANKLLIGVGFVATLAVGLLVVPRLADKASSMMIKNSASVDVPDEGPVIVKNEGKADGE